MVIRAVLFDWGDTLFTMPSAPAVILDVARERGVKIDTTTAERAWREVWKASQTAEEHAKGRDLSPEAHRAVWTHLFRRLDELVPGVSTALYERVMDSARWYPYQDTAPTLRALKARGLKVGVVSNIPHDLRPHFARYDLAGLVDAFVLSVEHGVAKPSPALFAAACRELGVAPSETLMVGDDPVSDGGARDAGLEVLLLSGALSGDRRGLDAVLRALDAANARRQRA